MVPSASLINDAAYRLSVPFLDRQPRTSTSLFRLALSAENVAPPRLRFDVDESWKVMGTASPAPFFTSRNTYACGFSYATFVSTPVMSEHLVASNSTANA